MDNTILIQITNQKALRLLHELEELHLIKVLKRNLAPTEAKLSDKYKGIFTKEEGEKFTKYIQQARKEWDRDI